MLQWLLVAQTLKINLVRRVFGDATRFPCADRVNWPSLAEWERLAWTAPPSIYR